MADLLQEDKEELEKMVREYGLSAVIRVLSDICVEKSREKISSDKNAAAHYVVQSEQLREVADEVDGVVGSFW
ncbi:MAG: hypothetical protein AAB581_01150 [Patescibacteria group bacterium]